MTVRVQIFCSRAWNPARSEGALNVTGARPVRAGA